MSIEIENFLSINKNKEAVEECFNNGYYELGKLLTNILKDNEPDLENICNDYYKDKVTEDKVIRVLLSCNWINSKELCDCWNKMSKGDYKWNNIQIVWEEPYDYHVIINGSNIISEPNKTIMFQMEPYIKRIKGLAEFWINKDENSYKFFGSHEKHFNNNEWHLSKTYKELSNEKIFKDESFGEILSTILSDKYNDQGHIKRIDFVKFLESKGLPVHVYGGNKFDWKLYKGALPLHKKDNSLFPYKYTFNVENNSIPKYYTEKLIDGILSETLVFYNGCPDIRSFIDERAYIYLELSNFEEDYKIIINSIKDNLWEKRLPYIKEAKNKILNEYQFFPRLEKIINS